ncbi:MAG TPA: FHA domain-containing protein [Pyrinomonadaceae bacterium]|jgi:3D (Asp-Asp-Asp) domain-containing protein|nr:FHA domain-containing protein [Pyrinomonadaceae bacterium]
MPEIPQNSKKNLSPDWFVQGALTKIGDMFDRLTGRGWKPSSSLATSEIIERMKRLMESEIKETEKGRKFVPHNIKLKMQWDKFSTDSEASLTKLQNELLTAAVDFINDHRYYTYAPLVFEVKPDYFTQGVKLFVSFDKFDADEREAEMNVTVPGMNLQHLILEAESAKTSYVVKAQYTVSGEAKQKRLEFEAGTRVSVGRTKENDIPIDDPSVSKFHASVMVNSDGRIVVADTGSTNGTFVDGERIAYGKAMTVNRNVKFGTVEVMFAVETIAAPVAKPELPPTEKFTVGEFEFTKRSETIIPAAPQNKSEPAANKSEIFSPQPVITEAHVKVEGDETQEPE